MSGQQFGGWQNRPGFVPPPFHFNVPLHDFSRPPPPIHARPPRPMGQYFQTQPRQFPVPTVDKVKDEDQEFVANWLMKRNSQAQEAAQLSNVPTQPIKLKDVKRKVARTEFLLCELERLQTEAQCDPEKQADVCSVKVLQSEIEEITSFLETWSPTIQQLVQKRRKKRQAQKSKKEALKTMRSKIISERQAKHRQIDAWRQEQKDIVEKAEREERMCKEADAILGEVRNKLSVGKGLLQVLDSLRKLRHLRAQNAADKNMFPSEEENERFETMLAKLEELWQLQLEEYAKEEQTLKVMMEKEQVDREAKPSSLDSNLKLWLRALFGKADTANNYELYFHTSAERDLDSLINTRRCWDQFLTSNSSLASSIPIGWIVPSKPSSEDWGSLLESMQ